MRDNSGEIYSGDWVNDTWEGTGRLRNKNVIKLIGTFDYTNFDHLGNYWETYSGQF